MLVYEIVIAVGEVDLSVGHELVDICVHLEIVVAEFPSTIDRAFVVNTEAPDNFFRQHIVNKYNPKFAADSSHSSLRIELNDLGIYFLEQQLLTVCGRQNDFLKSLLVALNVHFFIKL